MIPRDVLAPTVAIPFHKLLKIVAIVDANDPQAKELIAHLAAEHFEVELGDSYERDASEDASVGAYIGTVEGGRREEARKFARSVRRLGFRTPLWVLADSSGIADVEVVDMAGEVDGFVYLGQQTPAFYAKQIIASL